MTMYMTPAGFTFCGGRCLSDTAGKDAGLTESRILCFCTGISFYFSSRMIRLVLLFSPAAAICSGVVGASLAGWAAKTALTAESGETAQRPSRRQPPPSDDFIEIVKHELDSNPETTHGLSLMSLALCVLGGAAFLSHSMQMAPYLRATGHSGFQCNQTDRAGARKAGRRKSSGRFQRNVLLREDPQNARARVVIGYQIAGIAAARLADGNT